MLLERPRSEKFISGYMIRVECIAYCCCGNLRLHFSRRVGKAWNGLDLTMVMEEGTTETMQRTMFGAF